MSRIDIIGQNGNDGLHYGAAPADPIVESVRSKLLSRSTVGIAKYGTTLMRDDLSRLDWLKHAQEEAMDLANYLEVLIQQEEAAKSAGSWLDLDTVRADLANHMNSFANKRHGLDAALMHVVEQAYQKGIADASKVPVAVSSAGYLSHPNPDTVNPC